VIPTIKELLPSAKGDRRRKALTVPVAQEDREALAAKEARGDLAEWAKCENLSPLTIKTATSD